MNKNKFLSRSTLEEFTERLKMVASKKIQKGKYKGLLEIGIQKGKYNFKKLQIVSSFAIVGKSTENDFLINTAKEQILLSLQFQRQDGYFYTDKYSQKKDYARANVQFLCIELLQAFAIIKLSFLPEEKKIVQEVLLKSLNYVLGYISSISEANQIAGALLFMKMYNHEFGNSKEEEKYQKLKANLLDQQLQTGEWFEKWEAPGCDLLYLTLQLAYLARLSDFDTDPKLHLAVINGLKYVENFLLPSGEIDITSSKRWIPATPLGKQFVIYAFAKFQLFDFSQYQKKCLEKLNNEDIYYYVKAFEQDISFPEKIPEEKDLLGKNVCLLYKNNFRLSFNLGPLRISGGQLTSIYHREKGWILQQAPIGKNGIPSKCTQIRIILKNNTILNSSLDPFSIFNIEDLIVTGNMKVEDKKYFVFPFGYFKSSDASSQVNYRQCYRMHKNKIEVFVTLFFGEETPIQKISLLVPLTNGEITCNFQTDKNKLDGVYGDIVMNEIIPSKDKKFFKSEYLNFSYSIDLK